MPWPLISCGKPTTAAAATASLQFIFWGVAVTLPLIAGYSIYVYRVFGGKATELSYD